MVKRKVKGNTETKRGKGRIKREREKSIQKKDIKAGEIV